MSLHSLRVALRNWNNETVYWTSTSGSGTLQWDVNAGTYSNDDALIVTSGSSIAIDDTLITTNDLHITPTSSAATIAGTLEDAELLSAKIMHDVSDDSLGADAELLGVRVTLTFDAATSEYL